MDRFPHQSIESKWQERWERSGAHQTEISNADRKLYALVMFSYPSSDKLHVGHWYNFAPTDSWARFRRMQGYRVFEPMGFDAFGLPAENYAIKTGVHPADSTRANVGHIRGQLQIIGAMYDWSRSVNTSEPEYYRWTQWLFLKLFEAGLAYRAKAPVNWCPDCKTVLANEDVHEGCCWRCSTEVTRKDLEQWFFRITAFADQLLEGLEGLDWPEKTLSEQRRWIGRSEGAEVQFPLEGAEPITVFTTRPDTLYGATYLVLAPEHPLVEKLTAPDCREAVHTYVEQARRISERERTFTDREKTGVFLGTRARHPLTDEALPIWISDYVLMGYGTGAIMAVPAHDERDHEFARRHDLEIRRVIQPRDPDAVMEDCYVEPGVMVNSGRYSGMDSLEGGASVAASLAEAGLGGPAVSYKMRDWLVSRQRYWGAPIPMIHCPECRWVPVPDKQLPVQLPREVSFGPGNDGQSPLAGVKEFVEVLCPQCGGPARRETDTMDTFVDSSWYFLRYPSAACETEPFDLQTTKDWLPVDQYVGGPEHARGHLLFARFITRVLHDLGYLEFREPFKRLIHQGIITKGGLRMSKSKGNVIVPDDSVKKHGADTFRMYLMFMGSYEQGGEWSEKGLLGMRRFLERVWRLVQDESPELSDSVESGPEQQGIPSRGEAADNLELKLHRTVDSVTRDLDRFSFNTAIARLMELTTELERHRRLPEEVQSPDVYARVMRDYVKLLAPFAPHLGEEFWELLGGDKSVFDQTWPAADTELLSRRRVTIVVQINGRVRSRLELAPDLGEDELKQAALADEKIRQYVDSGSVRRVIVVPNRLVNVVVG